MRSQSVDAAASADGGQGRVLRGVPQPLSHLELGSGRIGTLQDGLKERVIRRHVMRLQFALLVALVLVAGPGVTGADAAALGGTLYYPRDDGFVAGVNADTGAEVATITDTAFVAPNVGSGREIAFDPVTRLMWYSASDGLIYSVNADTEVAGPSITSIPGGNVGANRHVFIDHSRRKLMTPLTDGSIQMYGLLDQQASGTIPATVFNDGYSGEFRHLASDERTGNVWYAATDGSFRELDPETASTTGKTILFSVQTGNNPGAFRHMVVDVGRDLLLYAVSDGSIASLDLTTLQAGTFSLAPSTFSSEAGASRIITYDSPSAAVAIVPGLGPWALVGLGAVLALATFAVTARARRPVSTAL